MKNQMPRSIEAEVGILGSVYLEPSLYGELSRVVSKDDFFDAGNREIWSVMGECVRRGQLDLITIKAVMEERGSLESTGGMAHFVEIVNETPTSDGAFRYAEIVADCGKRRRMMRGYADAYKKLTDMSENVETVSSYVQGIILTPNADRSHRYSFGEAYEDFFADYCDREKRGCRIPGISTGYEVLDYCIGGLEKGKMYVIGGRPAMGKTAFALNMAFKMARNGKNIAIFSLEMGAKQVVKRIVSLAAGIDGQWIQEARLDDKDKLMANRVREAVGDRMIINDRSSQTINSITAECMTINAELKSRGKRIDCVMIDHMQLMQSELKNFDRRTQIGEISRGCKLLASNIDCPVVIASQLSRELRNRGSKKPVLTDLRESGDIEQDADVVMLLHRESYYHQGEDDWLGNPRSAELILAKNRDGFVGTVGYKWEAEKTKFTEEGWDKQTLK